MQTVPGISGHQLLLTAMQHAVLAAACDRYQLAQKGCWSMQDAASGLDALGHKVEDSQVALQIPMGLPQECSALVSIVGTGKDLYTVDVGDYQCFHSRSSRSALSSMLQFLSMIYNKSP